MMQNRLAVAEWIVELGQTHLAQRRRIIRRLAKAGRDTRLAQDIMATFVDGELAGRESDPTVTPDRPAARLLPKAR
jgi:hypothetical protein